MSKYIKPCIVMLGNENNGDMIKCETLENAFIETEYYFRYCNDISKSYAYVYQFTSQKEFNEFYDGEIIIDPTISIDLNLDIRNQGLYYTHKDQIIKLYEYMGLNADIENIIDDINNDYLTINTKSAFKYNVLWYMDERHNIAINIDTGEIIRNTEIIL